MRRKVSKVGPATLVVSLPSKWAKKYNIKKGDEVDVAEKANSITISKESAQESEVFSFSTDDMDKSIIVDLIVASYVQGYDEIRINIINHECIAFDKHTTDRKVRTIDVIEEAVNSLIGFEIIVQKQDEYVLKNLSKTSHDDFDNLMKRINLLIRSMGNECIEGIKDDDKDYLKELVNKKRTIRKFIYYCKRILNKFEYKGTTNAILFDNILNSFETISELLRLIGLEYINDNSKLEKEAISLLENVLAIYSNTANLIYHYDQSGIISARKMINKAYKKVNEMHLTKYSRKTALFISRLSVMLHEVNNLIKLSVRLKSFSP